MPAITCLDVSADCLMDLLLSACRLLPSIRIGAGVRYRLRQLPIYTCSTELGENLPDKLKCICRALAVMQEMCLLTYRDTSRMRMLLKSSPTAASKGGQSVSQAVYGRP